MTFLYSYSTCIIPLLCVYVYGQVQERGKGNKIPINVGFGAGVCPGHGDGRHRKEEKAIKSQQIWGLGLEFVQDTGMGGTGGMEVNKASPGFAFHPAAAFNPRLEKEDAHKYSEVMYSILLNYWCEILIKKLQTSFKKEISEEKKN